MIQSVFKLRKYFSSSYFGVMLDFFLKKTFDVEICIEDLRCSSIASDCFSKLVSCLFICNGVLVINRTSRRLPGKKKKKDYLFTPASKACLLVQRRVGGKGELQSEMKTLEFQQQNGNSRTCILQRESYSHWRCASRMQQGGQHLSASEKERDTMLCL